MSDKNAANSRPQEFSSTKYGHIHAYHVTIPVEVVTNQYGIQIKLYSDAPNLGDELEIGATLTEKQVKDLLAKKVVVLSLSD